MSTLTRKLGRFVALPLGALIVVGLVVGLWLNSKINESLAQLDGEAALAGLSAPARIERDHLGVPTISAANRLDLARGTGYVHAQERFFQMDLMRRRAAGELAELFGAAALPLDRRNRIHGFRAVARQVVVNADAEERQILEAYSAGVNSGLGALRAPPFEYLALRSTPAPWRTEDSALVLLSMFLELQDGDGRRESALGVMADVLPEGLFRFLTPEGTEWDAPLTGGPSSPAPVPGPDEFRFQRSSRDPEGPKPPAAIVHGLPIDDLPGDADRGLPVVAGIGRELFGEHDPNLRNGIPPNDSPEQVAPGSNCWAVAGSRTADGRAILANDMHLDLTVPNTWYRASFSWTDQARKGVVRRIAGLTLPGTPAIVVGSNGHVAWGFTNSYIDTNDLVIVEDAPGTEHYRAPDGPRSLVHRIERIAIKGGGEDRLDVEETVWGPIVDRDHAGRRRALRWLAHDPDAVNFHLLRMETADTVNQALDIAHDSGIPAQNILVADSSGRIGWTICGFIPRRVGFDGKLPASWADGNRRWDGWVSMKDAPRIVDPPSGRLWTANARTVDGPWLDRLGDGGYVLGARAAQIRDGLAARPRIAERDMLAIQLDDRALFLERWRRLLLDALTPRALETNPRRRELRALVESWGGRASVDSVGYRMVRTFRLALSRQVIGALTQSCHKADRRFDTSVLQQMEGPLWTLVHDRPVHLLNPRYKDWDVQILAAVDEALGAVLTEGPRLAGRTWGERNAVHIQHPLARAVPWLSRWLDMPTRELPGDVYMPRVQAPAFGASERMVVSPGRETEGFLHMPCGQSGHPRSENYGDGQKAWEDGEPTAFLPGPTVHTLILSPARARTPK